MPECSSTQTGPQHRKLVQITIYALLITHYQYCRSTEKPGWLTRLPASRFAFFLTDALFSVLLFAAILDTANRIFRSVGTAPADEAT
jgi:hypothetical protein